MEDNHEQQIGITRLTVSGYKSISQECSIEIAPLTILAGANSSGKSSMMQPLLLIKQTLEAPFDPGALLLNGPHVRFTEASQLLSKSGTKQRSKTFAVSLCADENHPVTIYFRRQPREGFRIQKMTAGEIGKRVTFKEGMEHKAIERTLPRAVRKMFDELYDETKEPYELTIERDRSFLYIQPKSLPDFFKVTPIGRIPARVASIIHLPGLRGNPERSYPVTAVGAFFPGTFETYTASIIARWQADKNVEKLAQLRKDLQRLALASDIIAHPLNDTQVELRVSQFIDAHEPAPDTVNIADVGIGVSQTLPVLVALLTARPGQLVYIEQPEIHLHPRAQIALAEILADAAMRGIQVVIETHSGLLILAIQTLVAEGRLADDRVKLHWFTRQAGITHIATTELDRSGAFTEDWPEDFGNIDLYLQNRYLSAAEAVQSGAI